MTWTKSSKYFDTIPMAAWIVDGEVVLGIHQSGAPGRDHLVCRQLNRVDGQLPKWMHRGSSQSKLRRQLWRVEGCTFVVPMELCKVCDAAADSREVEGWCRRGMASGSNLCAGGCGKTVGAG